MGSCQCILKLWGKDEPEATVYQLRRYGRGKEAKLILIEGEEMIFHSFYLSLLRLLEEKKLVKYTFDKIGYLQVPGCSCCSISRVVRHLMWLSCVIRCIRRRSGVRW